MSTCRDAVGAVGKAVFCDASSVVQQMIFFKYKIWSCCTNYDHEDPDLCRKHNTAGKGSFLYAVKSLN